MALFDRNFINQVINRTSIVDVVGKKVVWDRKKSHPSKGDMWACCPFHNEKSPSFHVQEDKGLYYCFGCGENGGAIDFVMKKDSLNFAEAVKYLAQNAGMEIPKPSPEAEVKAKREEIMLEALSAARKIYEKALFSDEGKKAQNYLQNRGLNQNDCENFGLGFAPNSRNFLKDRLIGQGFAPDILLEAGLLRQSEDETSTFDTFRNRVIFAIENVFGQTISFGARTLEKDGMPKYLNGPDTPVFQKGQNLYRLKQARAQSRNQKIIVAEGYIDVIALEKNGFAAVAPLGTALSEDQLNLVWRTCQIPVLCFDGDEAGQNAAKRALNRALPLVKPNRSLSFVVLPSGKDPDDILAKEGRAKFSEILENATGLAKFLYDAEKSYVNTLNAEGRASFRANLRAKINEIKDEDLKIELRGETKKLLDSELGIIEQPRNFTRFSKNKQVTDELKNLIARNSSKDKKIARPPQMILDIVAAAILSPKLLDFGIEAFSELEIAESGLSAVREAILDFHNSHTPIDFSAFNSHFSKLDNSAALQALRILQKSPLNPYVRENLSFSEGQMLWQTALQNNITRATIDKEAIEAQKNIEGGEEEAFEKLVQLVAQRKSLKRSDLKDE